MKIRQASFKDADILSNIAYKSKAYWGYSEEFLSACKEELTVTVEDISKSAMYVIEIDSKIAGFYSFTFHPDKLEDFFINPVFIGKGLGKAVWEDILQKAVLSGLKEFTIDSDPYAEGFYLKMGAKRIGSVNSTAVPNRKLPLMKVVMS